MAARWPLNNGQLASMNGTLDSLFDSLLRHGYSDATVEMLGEVLPDLREKSYPMPSLHKAMAP